MDQRCTTASRSPGARSPVRSPVHGVARGVLSIVFAGMALAVAMALAAMRFVPEQSMREPSMRVAPPLDLEVLESGASLAELERGRSYYVQLCVPCHGGSGRGDGEWAYRMTPRPADLTTGRAMNRTDGELRAAIGEGVAGTAMRGWEDRLSETQIGQVIGYVRHLGVIEAARNASP